MVALFSQLHLHWLMLRFQHIEYLWGLWIIPLLIFLYFLHRKIRTNCLKKIGNFPLVEQQFSTYHKTLLSIKFILIILTFFFGIVALANLQSGAMSEKVQRKGIDVVFALDVSKSMLAKDIEPNRLEKAKQLIIRMIEKFPNNRIGLIIFAGRAYMSVPLTVDLTAFKMNLAASNPNMVPTQGTVIGEAINMARQAFNTKETKYKSIVLISDGEDHDESALDEAKKAVQEGIMINTVGIGSVNGSPIWDAESNDNKKDEKGNDVITKLNEKELQEIARQGQGVYEQLTNTESTVQAIVQHVNTIEQKEFGDSLFVNYNSYFQYFLIIGLLSLIIEFFIPTRKKGATI